MSVLWFGEHDVNRCYQNRNANYTIYLLVVFAYKGIKKVHQIRTGKKRKSRKKKDTWGGYEETQSGL